MDIWMKTFIIVLVLMPNADLWRKIWARDGGISEEGDCVFTVNFEKKMKC